MIEKISRSKTLLFMTIALISLLIAVGFDIIDSKFSFHELVVEFHGLVFDLFIFGILLTIYETINNRKEKIERYLEELNDYRFWESEESMYRTRGLIKRLIDLKVNELDLSFCYLATDKSFASYRNFRNWNFTGADINDSLFLLSDMKNANFYLANLKDTRFDQVNLTNCKFSDSNLLDTVFEKCIFSDTEFSGAIVKTVNWFDELEKNENIGTDFLRKKYLLKRNPETLNDIVTFIIKVR
jgi:hypothetical protein